MSVEAQILNTCALGAVTIPMKALQFDAENQPFVYKADANGKLYAQKVTIGINDGATIQILSGVDDGESVFRPIRRNALMPGMGMMRN